MDVDFLLRSLVHPNLNIRWAAIDKLGGIDDERVATALKHRFANRGEDPILKLHILAALHKQGRTNAIDRLADVLHGETRDAYWAARLLGELRDEHAFQVLFQQLKQDGEARFLALEGLRRRKDTEAARTLCDLLQDPTDSVQRTHLTALLDLLQAGLVPPDRIAELASWQNSDCKQPAPPDEQWTFLHQAVETGYLQAADLLTQHGANVNQTVYSGAPLHAAVARRDTDMTELLVNAGADLETTDTRGWTPLFVAAACHRPEQIRILLEHGANVDARDWRGQTALMTPLQYNGHAFSFPFLKDGDTIWPCISVLLEAGADVNSRDAFANTALHLAVRAAEIEVMDGLLSKEAWPNFTNFSSRTPLDYVLEASGGDENKAARRLRRYGAVPHPRDGSRICPACAAPVVDDRGCCSKCNCNVAGLTGAAGNHPQTQARTWIFRTICDILDDTLQTIDLRCVKREDDLVQDLGADSIIMGGIFMQLEEALNVPFEETTEEQVQTVGDCFNAAWAKVLQRHNRQTD